MRVTDDGWTPPEDWPTETTLAEPGWHAGGIEVVSADSFADVDEPGALAILGTFDDVVIPQGGEAMMYGDGGTGKTTLAIDLACHLAAGDDWCGIPVDEPVSVLLIEGEGPRPLFRRKLKRKLDGWGGSSLDGRLHVWQHPWGVFTFADQEMRGQLSRAIFEHEVDLVIAGPVTAIGMREAGTMAEVREFAALVQLVREGAQRPTLASLLVHHESKSGRVSGAWEGVGDCLIHVQGQGQGKTRVHMQKLRWSTRWHGKTLHLTWGDDESFALGDAPKTMAPEDFRDAIETYVLTHGGCSWGAVTDALRVNKDKAAKHRDRAIEDGVLVNAGQANAYELWHRDDVARPLTIDDEGVVVPFSRKADRSRKWRENDDPPTQP